MTAKSMLFIYNPWAGRRDIISQLHSIIDYFNSQNFIVTVRPTQSDNDAYKVVKEYATYFDYLVCSGGDGTLNETVHGLMEIDKDQRPFLGYLPSGSTNDFATSLGLSTDPVEGARIIARGTYTPIDVGRINQRYFAYIAAFGLFTDVSYDTSQSLKNIFGHTAYILEGMKRLTNIKSFDCNILVDGEELQDDYILGMVTNSASVGGFKLTTENMEASQGKFSLILLRQMPRLFDYSGVVASLIGGATPGEQFIIRQADRVEVTSSKPIAWTVDGEYGGSYCYSDIEIIKDAVNIFTNGKKKYSYDTSKLFENGPSI